MPALVDRADGEQVIAGAGGGRAAPTGCTARVPLIAAAAEQMFEGGTGR